MTYDIVSASSKEELIELVNEQKKLGWQLQGGVSVVVCCDETLQEPFTLWAQAMVSTIAPE